MTASRADRADSAVQGHGKEKGQWAVQEIIHVCRKREITRAVPVEGPPGHHLLILMVNAKIRVETSIPHAAARPRSPLGKSGRTGHPASRGLGGGRPSRDACRLLRPRAPGIAERPPQGGNQEANGRSVIALGLPEVVPGRRRAERVDLAARIASLPGETTKR
jgi:hypothetical protein